VSAPSADAGLQAERTALAWSRISLAVLANGVLLIVRVWRDPGDWLQMIAIVLAFAIAVATYRLGLRRQRVLARRPLPTPITAGFEVQFVGWSVLVLIFVTALALFV